jgi:hypothetical protein
MSKMLGQYSAVSYPHQNKEGLHINMCRQILQIQPPRLPDLNSLHLYLRGQFKTLVYSAPPENEETLNQGMFYAIQIIRNCAGTFARV